MFSYILQSECILKTLRIIGESSAPRSSFFTLLEASPLLYICVISSVYILADTGMMKLLVAYDIPFLLLISAWNRGTYGSHIHIRIYTHAHIHIYHKASRIYIYTHTHTDTVNMYIHKQICVVCNSVMA